MGGGRCHHQWSDLQAAFGSDTSTLSCQKQLKQLSVKHIHTQESGGWKDKRERDEERDGERVRERDEERDGERKGEGRACRPERRPESELLPFGEEVLLEDGNSPNSEK